jgi:acyl-CoA synthetase (NDP forming)
VIRVDTLEQLFDVANLLAHQPAPAGRRVAILTNAGGPGILAADACEGQRLLVAPLSEETTARLREFLPREAGLSNPVDMIASATAEQYGRALRVLLQDPGIDSVIAIFIPPLVTQAEDVAEAIRDAAVECRGEKTLVACFMSTKGAPPELACDDCTIPSYAFPEAAAMALAKASDYAEWCKRPRGAVPRFPVDYPRARRIAEDALRGGGEEQLWLPPQESSDLLSVYGIASARAGMARTASEARKLAEEIGFPVALKIASRTITHKTDIGGVVLGLKTQREVEEAFRTVQSRIKALGRLRRWTA